MSTVARLNPDLDIFMGHAQEATTMTTNGHAANRLAELTAPAKGNNLGDILDQLAELDPAAIDEELAALNKRVAILQNLRALVGGAGVPKAEGAAPAAAPGTKFEAARERILVHLAKHGPTRAGELAKACGVEPKALVKTIGKSQFITKGRNRLDPYQLTAAGRETAKKLRT